RPERDGTGGRLQEVEGDVGCVESWHDEEVGGALEARVGKYLLPNEGGKGSVSVHLAFDLELGLPQRQDLQHLAHLQGRGRILRAEARMRQQSHLGLDAEAAN